MPKPVRSSLIRSFDGTCTPRTALIAPFLASPVVNAGATGMPVMPASASGTARYGQERWRDVRSCHDGPWWQVSRTVWRGDQPRGDAHHGIRASVPMLAVERQVPCGGRAKLLATGAVL